MQFPNWFRVDGEIEFYRAWHIHATGLVSHGFSTRNGGVSAEPFDTLNLSFSVPDDPANVIENRLRFAKALDVDINRVIVPGQVHGNTVRRVDESHAGCGALSPETVIPETDALITNTPGITLALQFADCGSVFLLDPENRAIGLAHAGWKGTADEIVTRTIEAMASEFCTDPEKLLAAIGPSIGRCCYEVGPDTAYALHKTFPFDERVINQCAPDKWRADIKIANQELLLRAGVQQSNIAISEMCTSCSADLFFSHRRNAPCGRMGGWMGLQF